MPSILDRSEQMLSALKLTRKYGHEIDNCGLNTEALADLLPTLEAAKTLQDYHDFNEKARKWIDKHQPTP